MLITMAVVAHHQRSAQAYQLASDLQASLVMDHGQYGPSHNHLRAWAAIHTPGSDGWGVVVEDDAIPTSNFTTKLSHYLDTTPTSVVSLYAGTNYPPMTAPALHLAVTEAQHVGAHWAALPTCNHAVALAIRQPFISNMLEHIDPTIPIDEAIGQWARDRDMLIGYTIPSLVDHADGPTVIAHPDGQPRNLPRHAIYYQP